MNMEKRWSGTGSTIAETLRNAPRELTRDIVGLWSVVESGRGAYALSGSDLDEYVFRYVSALLSFGAVPIEPATDGIHEWQAVTRYGTEPADVARAIIDEWVAQGSPTPSFWEGLAFALPFFLDHPVNQLNSHGPEGKL